MLARLISSVNHFAFRVKFKSLQVLFTFLQPTMRRALFIKLAIVHVSWTAPFNLLKVRWWCAIEMFRWNFSSLDCWMIGKKTLFVWWLGKLKVVRGSFMPDCVRLVRRFLSQAAAAAEEKKLLNINSGLHNNKNAFNDKANKFFFCDLSRQSQESGAGNISISCPWRKWLMSHWWCLMTFPVIREDSGRVGWTLSWKKTWSSQAIHAGFWAIKETTLIIIAVVTRDFHHNFSTNSFQLSPINPWQDTNRSTEVQQTREKCCAVELTSSGNQTDCSWKLRFVMSRDESELSWFEKFCGSVHDNKDCIWILIRLEIDYLDETFSLPLDLHHTWLNNENVGRGRCTHVETMKQRSINRTQARDNGWSKCSENLETICCRKRIERGWRGRIAFDEAEIN